MVAALNEELAVARLTQRLRGHGAHMRFRKARQPFGKTGKAIPATLHGFSGQVLVFIQPCALAYGFLEVFDFLDVAVFIAADFQAKAVGPQVHGSQQCSILHKKGVVLCAIFLAAQHSTDAQGRVQDMVGFRTCIRSQPTMRPSEVSMLWVTLKLLSLSPW
ncbi:hypothetical protein SDC9_137857 [bioreactor metagenome]|uniref:Uncharacterized protein n=1 Tax=bioreactor metagenome TaxID=1076179 RepID=A0A645DNB8_9ZZZZ